MLDRQPNPHLGFARGAHACLGVPLARQPCARVLGHLAVRYPCAALDPVPVIEPIPALRGFVPLPVRLR